MAELRVECQSTNLCEGSLNFSFNKMNMHILCEHDHAKVEGEAQKSLN